MGLRKNLYGALETHNSDGQKLSTINRILVILVLVSFLLLALETEPSLGRDTIDGIRLTSLFLAVVFGIEYGVRLWVAGENPEYKGLSGRLKYARSFYALADLAAFLPEIIIMAIGPESFDPRTIAILKAFRLFRLFKLARYIPAFDLLGEAMKRAGGQLVTSLFLALALVFVSAIALWMIEGTGQPESFGSIPRAVWWAIATLTTVGYGDVYPETALGKVAASAIALAGIGVVALPAGVFASAFSDVIREQQSGRKKENTEDDETFGDGPSASRE